jgi:hypothetical protein
MLNEMSQAAALMAGTSATKFGAPSDEDYQTKKQALYEGLRAKLKSPYIPRMPGVGSMAGAVSPIKQEIDQAKLKNLELKNKLLASGESQGLRSIPEMYDERGLPVMQRGSQLYKVNPEGTGYIPVGQNAQTTAEGLQTKTSFKQTEALGKATKDLKTSLGQMEAIEKALGFNLDDLDKEETKKKIEDLPIVTGRFMAGSNLPHKAMSLVDKEYDTKVKKGDDILTAMDSFMNQKIHELAGSAATKQEMENVRNEFMRAGSNFEQKLRSFRRMKELILRGIEEEKANYPLAKPGATGQQTQTNIQTTATAPAQTQSKVQVPPGGRVLKNKNTGELVILDKDGKKVE